jgi:segregation and condensation protein B
MTLDQTLEAVLFAGAKPFSAKRLAEVSQAEAKDVSDALKVLGERLDASESGIMLQKNGNDYELVTRPDAAAAIAQVVSEEAQGELSRAALEALTILAYRGPMTRAEIEQIRGVHSSIILRNLMLRGLVEQKDEDRLGQPVYAVTFEFLNHLGVKGADELPEYAELRGHAVLTDMLAQLEENQPAAPIGVPSADDDAKIKVENQK